MFLCEEEKIPLNLEFLMTPWLLWFVFGLGLALLELALPGLIIIFFGIGCLVTAAVVFLFDLSLTQQILLFSGSSIAALVVLRRGAKRVFRGVSTNNQEDNFDDFPKGVRVPVTRPITLTEQGRIHYRGTDWYATADEAIESGAIVEILSYADPSRQVYHVRKIH